MNLNANAVDINVQARTAQVIPFHFEVHEVRTCLIDDQSWFAAQDVLRSLGYAESYKPARSSTHVPKQWKGVQRLHTPGGTQKLLMLSEQGLYFFLGRSDKPKALPFQMWLAGEVLPAIRKHGRYEDSSNKMTTLVNDVIGVSGTNLINGVIGQKIAILPVGIQRQAKHKLHAILRTRFNVPRTELIPAEKLDVACEYLAAYALEGEWLCKEDRKPGTFTLNEYQAQYINHLIHYTDWVCHRWNQGISEGLKAVNPKFHAKTWEFFRELKVSAQSLERAAPELMAYFQGRDGRGLRPHECIAKGIAVGHPAD